MAASAPDLPFGPGAIVFLCVYLTCCIVLGVAAFHTRHAANESSLRDHFLAGSGLGGFVLFCTSFAQLFSGLSLFAFPAEAFKMGLPSMMWAISGVGISIGCAIAAPRMWRLGRARGYLTPADVVRDRCGVGVLHALVSFTTLVPTGLYLVIQLKALSSAVPAITRGRVGPRAGTWLSAVVMLTYDMLGGMRAVAWTDCLQAVFILGAFMLMLVLGQSVYGGLPSACGEMAESTPWRTATPSVAHRWELASMLGIWPGYAIFPHVVTRTYAAKTEIDIRTTTMLLCVAPVLAHFACMQLGWTATPALLRSGEDVQPDVVLLHVMAQLMASGQVGYWVATSLMASVIAALMSTADSCLMAVSVVIARDGVLTYAPGCLESERSQLWLGRAVTLCTMVVTVVISTLDVPLARLGALMQQVIVLALPSIVVCLHADEANSVNGAALLAGLGAGWAVLIAILIAAGDVAALIGGVHPGTIAVLCNIAVAAAVWALRGRLCAHMQRPPSASELADPAASTRSTWGSGADEPARKLPWVFGAVLPLLLLLATGFWRSSGEQEDILLFLPAWAELQFYTILLMGLCLAIAVRWGWEVTAAGHEHDGAREGETGRKPKSHSTADAAPGPAGSLPTTHPQMELPADSLHQRETASPSGLAVARVGRLSSDPSHELI